jgi:drug/metabolite transporter (DMT)-like permease
MRVLGSAAGVVLGICLLSGGAAVAAPPPGPPRPAGAEAPAAGALLGLAAALHVPCSAVGTDVAKGRAGLPVSAYGDAYAQNP